MRSALGIPTLGTGSATAVDGGAGCGAETRGSQMSSLFVARAAVICRLLVRTTPMVGAFAALTAPLGRGLPSGAVGWRGDVTTQEREQHRREDPPHTSFCVRLPVAVKRKATLCNTYFKDASWTPICI